MFSTKKAILTTKKGVDTFKMVDALKDTLDMLDGETSPKLNFGWFKVPEDLVDKVAGVVAVARCGRSLRKTLLSHQASWLIHR